VVAVVADSAANVPPDLAGELRIELVPLYLKFGDTEYRDGVDMAPRDFYRRLVRDDEAASTATPSPADFLEAYERTGEREIVCVTIASTMSGSHQQARVAAGRFDGQVEVVDSTNASMAEGFVAAEAARAKVVLVGDHRQLGAGSHARVARVVEAEARVELREGVDAGLVPGLGEPRVIEGGDRRRTRLHMR